jgi:putative FmdB family regulatory protein
MPIYTYRCESCGVQFERHQSFTDEPLKRCPECNKNSLRKVLTPAGIIFKGSGWYATDHKSTSGLNRPAKTESKESAPASASSSESSGSSSSTESSGSGSAKSDSTGNAGGNSSAKSESSGKSGDGSNNKRESSGKSNE